MAFAGVKLDEHLTGAPDADIFASIMAQNGGAWLVFKVVGCLSVAAIGVALAEGVGGARRLRPTILTAWVKWF